MAAVRVGAARFECPEGTSVLVAMQQRCPGAIPVGCRNGGCGVCKVRVRSGEYHTGKMSRAHVSEAEEAEGWALACRTFAEGDLELEVG